MNRYKKLVRKLQKRLKREKKTFKFKEKTQVALQMVHLRLHPESMTHMKGKQTGNDIS